MMTMYDIIMRTIVDIPEEDIRKLSNLCKREGISRAEAIRRAISLFLSKHAGKSRQEMFGIWADRDLDGVEYQRDLRKEWD